MQDIIEPYDDIAIMYVQKKKNVPEVQHVLLFRKSDFLFFKVLNTNKHSAYFFRNTTFLFVKIEDSEDSDLTNV